MCEKTERTNIGERREIGDVKRGGGYNEEKEREEKSLAYRV